MSNAGKKIKIVKLEPVLSKFPAEVCEALVDCEFVCVDDRGFLPTPIASASGATIAPILCYHVDQRAVIDKIRTRSILGGLWLDEHYPQPDHVFTFYPEQVKVI